MTKRRKKSRRRVKKQLPIYPRVLLLALVGVVLLAVLLLSDNPPVAKVKAPVPHEPQAYFQTMAPLAQEMQHRYGVRASVMLAQSALESDYGRSQLAADYNNYFGIKGNGEATDVRFLTQEVYAGETHIIEDAFRSYPTVNDSFRDYAQLLTGYDRYAPVVNAATYEEAAYALQTAGYATDLHYPAKVITLIETYHLDQYDLT